MKLCLRYHIINAIISLMFPPIYFWSCYTNIRTSAVSTHQNILYVMREHLFWTGDNIQYKKLVKFLSFHETKVNIRGSGLVHTTIVEIEARTRRWVDLFSFNTEIIIKLSNLYVQGNTYISPLSFTSYKPHNMVQKCIWTLQQHFTTQCQPADLIACCWKNFPIF